MADRPEDVMTDQEILDLLNDWHKQGLFDWYVASEPLGEKWKVGQDGMILTFNSKPEIQAFISGCNCVLRTFAAKAGMTL